MEKEEKIERKDANEKEKASERTKAQNGKATDRNVVSNQNPTESLVPQIEISNLIYTIRGQQVMLDRDLAKLYGVETKRLNEQVKRNIKRFPKDFMFPLDHQDVVNLRSQIATSSWGGNRYSISAFTESGIAMLSSVLNSDIAIEVNIRIMRAFTSMRKVLMSNAQIVERLSNMEYQQIATEKRIDETVLTMLDKRNTSVSATKSSIPKDLHKN